jgi:AcrR family transcriptional regulator
MPTKRDPSTFDSAYRTQKFQAKLDLILETARTIMREYGVAALSMQELARRLNLRAPSLYNYFNSKLEIYDALFRLGFQQYRNMIEQATQQDTTWQDFVRHNFETYLNFAKMYPELFQLCFERPVPGFVPSPHSLAASQEILAQAYRQTSDFKDQIDTELSSSEVTNILIALMHGITAMHIANEPELPAGEGRFGSLIPAAMELLGKAWKPRLAFVPLAGSQPATHELPES